MMCDNKDFIIIIINVNNVLIENVEGYIYSGQHYYSIKEKYQDKEIKRNIMAGWAAYAKHRPGTLQEQPCNLPEEAGVELLCSASYDIWCRDLDTDQTSTEQTCGRTDQNGKQKWTEGPSERSKVIDIISYLRKMKWSWAGHINRLKDDRWISITCETMRHEKMTRETSQIMERRPRQILDGYDLAKDSAI